MQTGAISSGFSLEFAHPQDTHSLPLEEGRGSIYTSALVCFTLIGSTALIMATLPMWFAISGASGAVLVVATALYLRAQPSSNSAGRPIDYLEESEQSSNLTISTDTRQTATLSPIPTPPLPELPNPANNISEEVKTHLVPLLENTGTLVSTKLLIPLGKSGLTSLQDEILLTFRAGSSNIPTEFRADINLKIETQIRHFFIALQKHTCLNTTTTDPSAPVQVFACHLETLPRGFQAVRQLVAVKLADFTSLHTLYITSHINAAHLSHLIRDLAFFNLETLVITLYDDEKKNSFPPELIQNLKKLTLLKKFSLSSPSLDTFPEDFFSNFPLLEEVSLCLYKASSNFTIENIGITPQSQLKDVRLTLPQPLANQLDIKNYSSKLPKIQITAYQGK